MVWNGLGTEWVVVWLVLERESYGFVIVLQHVVGWYGLTAGWTDKKTVALAEPHLLFLAGP